MPEGARRNWLLLEEFRLPQKLKANGRNGFVFEFDANWMFVGRQLNGATLDFLAVNEHVRATVDRVFPAANNGQKAVPPGFEARLELRMDGLRSREIEVGCRRDKHHFSFSIRCRCHQAGQERTFVFLGGQSWHVGEQQDSCESECGTVAVHRHCFREIKSARQLFL